MNQTDMSAEKELTARETVKTVAKILAEHGYDPIPQIAGYLLSEDPAHIPNYQSSRDLIMQVDRDDILREMIELYLGESEE